MRLPSIRFVIAASEIQAAPSVGESKHRSDATDATCPCTSAARNSDLYCVMSTATGHSVLHAPATPGINRALMYPTRFDILRSANAPASISHSKRARPRGRCCSSPSRDSSSHHAAIRLRHAPSDAARCSTSAILIRGKTKCVQAWLCSVGSFCPASADRAAISIGS